MRTLKPNARQFLALMARFGLSQADAARAMHYSTATISRWCSGEVDCPDSAVDHLARITGLQPDEPAPARLSDGPIWLEAWQTEVLAIFGALTPERRKTLIAALHELIRGFSAGVRYRKAAAPTDDSMAGQKMIEKLTKDITGRRRAGARSSGAGAQPQRSGPDATQRRDAS